MDVLGIWRGQITKALFVDRAIQVKMGLVTQQQDCIRVISQQGLHTNSVAYSLPIVSCFEKLNHLHFVRVKIYIEL